MLISKNPDRLKTGDNKNLELKLVGMVYSVSFKI